MNPREVVRRTVRFQNPPRYAFYCNAFDCNDTVDVFDFFMKDENGVDPWGIKWEVHPDVPSIGIPKEHPLANSTDLSRVKIPDPVEFAGKVAANLRALSPEDRQKYRFIATSSGIWERLQYWRGMDNIFEDVVLNPELVLRMATACTDFWVAFLEELGPQRDELDALYMFDDWGTQRHIMIHQEAWRACFAEPYRRITEAAHANDMDFWLHSCGHVTGLIEDFIEVGMDLVNPYQSKACGYEEVADKFAGRIAFLTTVDTQQTLPHAPPAQVLAECRLLERWGTPAGGLIPATYGYDIPREREQLVFDYFRARKPGGAQD